MQVVGAVFRQADQFLVCRKKSGLSNEGLWEFPGGKRKPDESLEAALVREVAEELSVCIKADQLAAHSLGNHKHNTGSATIELHCYVVTHWLGEFALTDHDQMQWCTLDELRTVALSEADKPFIDRIEAYMQAD